MRGVPARYRPGKTYRLELRVSGAELRSGGFQLSARCVVSEREGEQAGELEAAGGRAEVVEGTGETYRGAEDVQYARHTKMGTRPDSGRAISWSLRWRAPDRDGDDGSRCGQVIFHVAGNAGNGDASEFGDRIYLETISTSTADP